MNEIKRAIVEGEELTSALRRGIDKLANTVKTTMVPKGKLVLIERPGQHPIITKDGVTVANAINLEDEVENLGAQVIKESAARTAEEAGDGTTTATVLAQSLYNEGLKMISAGFDVVGLKKGIQIATEAVVQDVEKSAQKIKSTDDLRKVALISANGEKDIADLIVDAIEASGEDGHVIVEEAKGFKSSLTVVEGYQIDRGFLSPYFVTDKNKMTCVMNRPLILMADRNFNSIHELMKPLEMILETQRPVLIVGNDIDGEAMQGLVLNRVKGSLQICAIKSPGFGGSRHDLLNDLEAVVGGKVINSSYDMQNFDMSVFGTCKRVIVDRAKTLFINDENSTDKEQIQSRIETVKSKLTDPGLESQEKELLKYRLQQLAGGIAILRVGAATESELIERYDRVDDALNATRAALQEGILPGGGVALARASKILRVMARKEKDPNVCAGINIVAKTCEAPFKQIVTNSGKSPDSILAKVFESSKNTGYDSRDDVLGNMYDLGIVDPKKVVRCAIENATSASSMLLSVGASMIETSKTQDS